MGLVQAEEAHICPPVLFCRVSVRNAPLVGPWPAGMLILGAYMQMGLLGALLTFAPEPLYAIHQGAPLDWGFTPLSDQQLGGIIMWVPAGIPYAGFGALVALRGWRRLQGRPA